MNRSPMSAGRVPVLMIYGLPGAGKTTLTEGVRKECLQQHRAHRMALGNERDVDDVRRLAEQGGIDYLFLEISGAGNPESIAVRLSPDSRAGKQLAQFLRLDAVVAVVDASTLIADFSSWDGVADRGLALGLHDDRALAELLAEQIEFADVVVLSKTGVASASTRHAAGVLVRALNPDAAIIESEFGRVPARKVLFTYGFEFAQAQGRARWIRTLAGTAVHEAEMHGISSFLYRARRPFHPQRLMSFVRSAWPGVVRCRGFFWLATRMHLMGELSQAGAARRFRAAGSWWATWSEKRTIDSKFMEEISGIPWDSSFGDRRQELAFVGIDMDEVHLKRRLDECLLDRRELVCGPATWQTYEDPFATWEAVAPSCGLADFVETWRH